MKEVAKNSSPDDCNFIFGPVSLLAKVEELIASRDVVGFDDISISENGLSSYKALSAHLSR